MAPAIALCIMKQNNARMDLSFFKQLFPHALSGIPEELIKRIQYIPPDHHLLFIANAAHETAMFTKMEESLNYSAARLLKVFPNRIKTLEDAQRIYASGRVAIADAIYGGRLGNKRGTNDGYNYIGRGLLQLTGRENYRAYAQSYAPDNQRIRTAIIKSPQILTLDPVYSVGSAIWYWNTRVVPKLIIAMQKAGAAGIRSAAAVIAARKAVAGGVQGLNEVTTIYAQLQEARAAGWIS